MLCYCKDLNIYITRKHGKTSHKVTFYRNMEIQEKTDKKEKLSSFHAAQLQKVVKVLMENVIKIDKKDRRALKERG